jgi:hypothetical protein
VHATSNSNIGNAARVADAFLSNSASGIPLESTDYASDLTSLRLEIESASRETVADPESECRQSMGLLALLAADPGPIGAPAREALCDLYENPPENMPAEVRAQLLNTALELCVSCEGAREELSATVLYMAGRSAEPPVGNNGAGHRNAITHALAAQLGPDFEREPDLLAENRNASDAEQLAAIAKLKNLNWCEPVSLAKPEAAKRGFERMLSDVAVQQKTVTVWVEGANGNCVPVVAQPLPSGGIRFHVIARNEAGEEVGRQLSELAEDDCVITHTVKDPYLALKHIDANLDHDGGVGAVIREHIDAVQNMSAEDQAAAKLVGQVEMFEAVAENRSQRPTQALVVASSVSPPVPSNRHKSLEDNFNAQQLTKQSGQIHSCLDRMVEAISYKVKYERSSENDRLKLYVKGQPETSSAKGVQNFYKPALEFAQGFNEVKAPLLFKAVDSKHPLASVSKTLREFGSAESAIKLTVDYQQRLLQECLDASDKKDLPRLKKALDDVVKAQAKLVDDTDKAIAGLATLEKADFELSSPELTAQARDEAKILIAALKQYRECLTGENSAEGNVYVDFVAFAKQATTFGPSLEAAQAMFKGIGSKPRTIPTPAAALQTALPEIVGKLPVDADVPNALQTPAATMAAANAPLTVRALPEKPQPTPAEFRALASAAGFGKSWDGNLENVSFSGMTDVMQTHSEAAEAGRRTPDPLLSRMIDAKLIRMSKPASDLAKAMMEVNRVQAKLAKSSIWEQSYVGTQNTPLGRGGANLLALPHQGPLVVREPLTQAANAAAAVKAAGNGPTAATAQERAMAQFNRELVNAKQYVQSQLKRMDEGIAQLKDIEASRKAGKAAKADAREMRGALEKLKNEWENENGLPQQIVKFAAAAAVNPEQAVAALNA